MRNKEMDLLKAIGIIYVLGIHYHLPWIFKYPSGSFLLPLFYFISGYFFKSVYEFHMKFLYISKKTKELIIPYVLYQILFTIISYFLQIYFSIHLIDTYSNVDFLRYPIILIFKPLFGGISTVFVASWFVSDLWITLIIMQLIYSKKNNNKKIDFIYFVCFLLIALVNIHWSHTSPRHQTLSTSLNTLPYLDHTMFKRIFIRTSLSLFFLFSGIIYREYIENYQEVLFTGRNFCLAFICISQIEYYYRNNIDITYFNAEFGTVPVWLPILTSFIGIYIFVFISKCLSKYTDDNDILIKIGNETFHIMCQHMFWYLSLNIITISFFHSKNFQVLSSNVNYKYQPEANWPIYIACGLLIPTFSAIYVRKFIKQYFVNTTSDGLKYTIDMSSIY